MWLDNTDIKLNGRKEREIKTFKERGENLFPDDIWKIDGKSVWHRLFFIKLFLDGR